MRFLPRLLEAAVACGDLTLTGPDGRSRRFGDGTGPAIRLRVADRSLDWRIPLDPEAAGPEALIAGGLVLEEGEMIDLVRLYFANRGAFRRGGLTRLRERLTDTLRPVLGRNAPGRARANAAHHYDLGNDFYRLWLDREMQYSCAYFEGGDEDLEAAQRAKVRHIAAKLRLRRGQRVLDIGCGWGATALYLARVAEVEVTGVTLSKRQCRAARARAEALGLSDRVRFELRDFRAVRGRFDRIVSIGMAEHVGAAHLPRYFETVRDRLAEDGVALVHLIGSADRPSHTGPFLARHVFPGGYTPALSETAAAVERAGIWTLDCEIWRLHYAETLAAWRRRFLAHRAEIEAERGARFVRLWELYLAVCEGTFRWGPSAVFQLQLARSRDAVPLTRDYIAQEKAALERCERLAGVVPSGPARLRPEPADDEPERRREA